MPSSSLLEPAADFTVVAAVACGATLLISGVGHLRGSSLKYDVATHGLFTLRGSGVVARTLPAAEIVLPLLGVVGLLVADVVYRGALLAAAALFGLFGLYLAMVLRRRGSVASPSCGCGFGDHPIGPVSVVRAGVLAALAVFAWANDGSASSGLLTTVCVTVTALCLLSWLPVAISAPLNRATAGGTR